MRDKIILTLGVLGTLLMAWNLNTIANLPDDALQGYIFRIIFIHVPAAIASQVFFTVSLVACILFVLKKNFFWDSLAVSCIEVGTMLCLINLVTGSIWGHIIWGIWWAWDLRMTSQLMCFLLYLGYILIRPAIAEPTQRAMMSSIVGIFAYADIPLVDMAIRMPSVRTQHPQPVLETGTLDPIYRAPFGIGILVLVLLGSALVLVRLNQEHTRREIDSLRRQLHHA
jgi:heme exporter protein C